MFALQYFKRKRFSLLHIEVAAELAGCSGSVFFCYVTGLQWGQYGTLDMYFVLIALQRSYHTLHLNVVYCRYFLLLLLLSAEALWVRRGVNFGDFILNRRPAEGFLHKAED